MYLVWISIGVVLILAGVVLAWSNYLARRRGPRLSDDQIQQEVVAHLARTLPTLKVVELKPREIKLHNASGEEATMYLENLIASINASRGRDEDRARIYDEFTRPLGQYAGVVQVAPIATQTASIFPRLVHREYLDQMAPGDPVHRRIGETPLHVAYVLDEENSVRFITSKDLAELAMTQEQLEALAMGNFRPRLPEKSFREIMERPGKATVISTGDSYDASRVLLLMEHLGAGEVLGVAVPDRDTLVVVPQPDDAAWASLAGIAAKPRSSRVMLGRPLRITSLGMEVR
jgi:uncharacterized protein YtpQ (UPF0354 family)